MPPRRVLLIDDEPAVGELVRTVAESLGVHCEAVQSAPAFFAALHPEVSLIFLDLRMSGLDGVEILRLLSQRASTPPIVLMSGMGPRVLETAQALAGSMGLRIAGYLLKPFRVAEVEAILRKQIDPELTPLRPGSPGPGVTAGELRSGLARDEFELHFQPQWHIGEDRIAGLEALVRWHHPAQGLLLPGQFIPFAEANGLINPLGWAVIRKALAAFREIAGSGGSGFTISINVPVQSVEDLSFPERLIGMAAQAGVEAEQIVLELTESGLIRRRMQTLDVLTRLRMRGVGLSIDDFGTGYSMIQQLRDVPATELKIDRDLINEIDTRESVEVMVRKMIEMGHELGMRIVAEGIERDAQRAALDRLRCDLLQGTLFCEPLPLFALQEWMATSHGFGRKRSIPVG